MSSRRTSSGLQSLVLPAAGVVLFLCGWQGLATGPWEDTGLPAVPGTLDALSSLAGDSTFWSSVGATVREALAGFALSVVVALPLGLYAGISSFGHSATRLTIEILKPIPAIVVLPLAVLELGTSNKLAVFLVMFTLIPMLTITVAAGARDTDPVTLDAARSYGLGSLARTWRVVVPSALPFIVTGLRVAASFALVVAVVAGLYGGAPGLGRDLDTYRQAGEVETAFAYVFVLGVLGIALNAVLSAFERRVLFWHESVRSDSSATGTRSVVAVMPSAWRARLWRAQDACERQAHQLGALSLVRTLTRTLRPRRPPVSEVAWRWLLRLVMVLVPLAVLAAWWVRSAGSVNPFFPPLSDIVDRFSAIWLSTDALENAYPSLRNLVIGFALGTTAGIAAGAVIGQVQWLYRMLTPLVSFTRSIPSIAYLPILISLIGFTAPMRVTAITLAAFFPVLIASIDGVRGIDQTLLDAVRSYRIPRRVSFFSVRLPAAVPRIFVGAELGLVAALIVMVASELIGATQGIGAQVLLAQQTFQFADMWAGLLLLGAIGITTNLVFRLTRRRALAWYDGARAAAKAQ